MVLGIAMRSISKVLFKVLFCFLGGTFLFYCGLSFDTEYRETTIRSRVVGMRDDMSCIEFPARSRVIGNEVWMHSNNARCEEWIRYVPSRGVR